MKLFQSLQWTVRRLGNYVKVSRPTEFKTVTSPKEDKSSLAKALHLKITASGPITVADYMKACLTNPSVGYYMQKDIIGQKGDFITSPEINQLFGEIIGVWIVNEFQKIGSPKPWQIIELGPGRGSLIGDILRTLRVLKATDELSVHLVEVSPQLAAVQHQNLCDAPIGIGIVPQVSHGQPHFKSGESFQSVPIYWYESLDKIPNAFSVILAHEFYDALPIHKFQRVGKEWREVLINSSIDDKGNYKFEYVLSQKYAPMSKLLIREDETRDHVEICADAGVLAGQVATRLEEYGGFSLFIDYGHCGDKTDTFRAFRKHQVLSPLEQPGAADLTADVDFSFLRDVMKDKLVTFGPVEQGDFLEKMGIKLRLNMLLKNAQKDLAEQLESGCRMITDKNQMGSRYKCFAAFPSVLEDYLKRFPVAGFS